MRYHSKPPFFHILKSIVRAGSTARNGLADLSLCPTFQQSTTLKGSCKRRPRLKFEPNPIFRQVATIAAQNQRILLVKYFWRKITSNFTQVTFVSSENFIYYRAMSIFRITSWTISLLAYSVGSRPAESSKTKAMTSRCAITATIIP